MSWAAHVADPRHSGRLLATGYSCRCQAALLDHTRLLHPVQVLLRAVAAGSAPVAEHAAVAGQLAPERHEEYRLAADPS
jgi:hypothetical protein